MTQDQILMAMSKGIADQAKGVQPPADAWPEYVAGMVVAYLGGGVDDERIKPIAGIIRQRMWLANSTQAPVLRLVQQARELCAATLRAGPGVAVELPAELAAEGRKFMRGEPSLIEQMPFVDVQKLGELLGDA
jgi:hypothetical protein